MLVPVAAEDAVDVGERVFVADEVPVRECVVEPVVVTVSAALLDAVSELDAVTVALSVGVGVGVEMELKEAETVPVVLGVSVAEDVGAGELDSVPVPVRVLLDVAVPVALLLRD